MFLVPQLKYVSILRKADPHEKYELESVNETHQKEGFFDKSMLGLEQKTKVSKMDSTNDINFLREMAHLICDQALWLAFCALNR